MKKYIRMAVMICFMAVNLSWTVLAAQNSNIKVAPEDYIPVLMYHHFVTGEVEAGNGVIVPIDEFEEHIKTLQKAGYTTIFLSDLYEIMQQLEKGKKFPELHLNQKYVAITIDDGYKSNYELVYPLLQKYNMKASISVITSLIGTNHLPEEVERMSWENLNEMQQSGLVEIYNHTYDHIPVGDRTYAEVCSSVKEGEEMLDKYLQKRSPVKVLTYPNGNYRQEIALPMQTEMQYDLQITTNIAVVNGNTSLLEIPRITVDSGWTGEKLLQMIEYRAQQTFQQKNFFFDLFAAHRLRGTSIIGFIMLSILFIIPKVTNKK